MEYRSTWEGIEREKKCEPPGVLRAAGRNWNPLRRVPGDHGRGSVECHVRCILAVRMVDLGHACGIRKVNNIRTKDTTTKGDAVA